MDELTSIEELQRRLREAEERVDRELQRAEREQQRAEALEQQTQPTTLHEYVAACHSLVFSSLNTEPNRKLTSTGLITNPRNKCHVFENGPFLSGLGKRISVRSISDEKTLESFLHSSVEDPVKAIIDQLKQVENLRNTFELGGIIFENHPYAISDLAEEVVYRDTPSTPPATPNHSLDLNRLRPDQICVYRSDNAYKPPHKLTAPHLRLGLRPMNIYKEVVNRKTTPTSMDPDARFQYHAERLTAAAITQTYHYMIEGGLEYGLLTTGEAIVFLKIDWSEPGTLLYHLAEPNAEVLAHPSHFHLCTAVGQYLAFSLVALGLPGY
ncbi:uncharacterized protein PgNI_12346 [Pyricularia grisea]|uniref:Uncharacterized protein n=1 Tax=Pyricularia grisea TaxID=148305 RepID=A0A6P8AMW9_PYRGI|nr:uncharacterized protein PgNI_12346 [Pyricularia grisea]TLD03388.1 hypothetical protein PgNI_12346 [Pyricularia grisea]